MLDLLPMFKDINRDTTLRPGISILSRGLSSEERMEDYTYNLQSRNENGTKTLATKLLPTKPDLSTSNINPSDVDGNLHNNSELPWGDLKTKVRLDVSLDACPYCLLTVVSFICIGRKG